MRPVRLIIDPVSPLALAVCVALAGPPLIVRPVALPLAVGLAGPRPTALHVRIEMAVVMGPAPPLLVRCAVAVVAARPIKTLQALRMARAVIKTAVAAPPPLPSRIMPLMSGLVIAHIAVAAVRPAAPLMVVAVLSPCNAV